MKKVLRWLFIFFAIGVGLYPFLYVFLDMSQGLLASKPEAIRESIVWNTVFYLHILPGAIALLAGWSQFLKGFRQKNIGAHRLLGKVYLGSVLISGLAGLYLAFFATAGIIAQVGFTGLALGWLFTSIQAYRYILKRNVDHHQYWMIRSYALCFAAVTLRIWLPAFQFIPGLDFFTAYRIIAWLCWVPNLLVAEALIFRIKTSRLIRVT